MNNFRGQPRTEILAYTAGFIDGEGYMGINQGSLLVQVSQKDINPLNFLKEVWGGSIHRYGKKKTQARWAIKGKLAESMLWQIKAFLIVKKDIVNTLISQPGLFK